MKKTEEWLILFDKWKARINTLVREHPLQIISWEATRRCNLHCVHCGSPTEDANHQNELSTEEIIGAFNEIAHDFDMSKFRHINITGGEPFVREDIIEILYNISKWPFYRNIDIQTNGIFIADNPEILNELKHYGVNGLGVSIDGSEETHDSFRGMSGAWSKAFEAARLSVEKGYIVTVSCVAHSSNVDELPSFFDFVRKVIKPRVFRVMTIDPLGRTAHDSPYLLSSNQVKQVIEFLKEEYEKTCPSYSDSSSTMVELGCGGWLGTELEGLVRPFIFHCIAGINNLGILYDGKLASCSNISRDFVEGDLRKDQIYTVWESRYEKYRNFEWKKTGYCADCDQWDFCHGGPHHKRSILGSTADCIFKILNEK